MYSDWLGEVVLGNPACNKGPEADSSLLFLGLRLLEKFLFEQNSCSGGKKSDAHSQHKTYYFGRAKSMDER